MHGGRGRRGGARRRENRAGDGRRREERSREQVDPLDDSFLLLEGDEAEREYNRDFIVNLKNKLSGLKGI